MRIDVWTDPLCPFCHIGRRQLELALEEFEHADEVHLFWRSYQLDPDAPAKVEGRDIDRLATKYGISHEQMEIVQGQLAEEAAAVGLDYRWERTVGGNSYDAQRLIHAAREQGLEEAVTHRILRGWFSEGRSLGDHDTLVELAAEAGMDAEIAQGVLDGDAFGPEVRGDLDLAARLGVSAVPFFVLDQKFGVSGAQPVPTLLQAIRYAWDDQGNQVGGGCGGGACGCGEGAGDRSGEAVPAGGVCGSGGCGSGGCGCR